jgi:hypothetical protein
MKTACLVTLALLLPAPALAACPTGENAMLTVRLYLGQEMNGRTIAPAAFRDFLARTVTPRFPSGFTVYDAQGQWRDTRTHAVTRESSKVVEIIGPDSAELRNAIADIRKNYIARFHQQAVGLVEFPVCGTFE